MKYENPEACSQSIELEYFNQILKMLTQMGKPIRAEELSKVLKFAKKMSAYTADVVRNDMAVTQDEDATKFWNQVYHLSNG